MRQLRQQQHTSGGCRSQAVDVYSSLPLQGASKDQTGAWCRASSSRSTQAGDKAGNVRSSTRRSTTRRLRPELGSRADRAERAQGRAGQEGRRLHRRVQLGRQRRSRSRSSTRSASRRSRPANTYVGPDHERARLGKGEPREVLPDGQAHLPAHRPARHDPGRGAHHADEERRLHEGRDRQRQGDLRRGPGPLLEIKAKALGATIVSNTASRRTPRTTAPTPRRSRPRARTASSSAASPPTARSRSTRTSARRCRTPSCTARTASASPASPTRRRRASRRRSASASSAPSRR